MAQNNHLKYNSLQAKLLDEVNHFYFSSLNYAVPGCQGNFQRTFPLRKSGKEDVSETYDIRHVLPTTSKTSTEAAAANWKSSASTDRLSSQTTSALDPFWTPSRTRRSLNKATHINGNKGHPDIQFD